MLINLIQKNEWIKKGMNEWRKSEFDGDVAQMPLTNINIFIEKQKV